MKNYIEQSRGGIVEKAIIHDFSASIWSIEEKHGSGSKVSITYINART